MATIHICHIDADNLGHFTAAHNIEPAAKDDLVTFCRAYWKSYREDEEMPSDVDELINEVFENED